MTMDLPDLTKKDIEVAFADLRRREKQGRHLFAFHGRYAPGSTEMLISAENESFRVVPIQSELDLRRQMPALGEQGAPIAFVVPWSGEVPLDLAGRFSRNGQISRIGKESRLKRLLGVSELGDGIVGSALGEHLLAHPNALEGAVSLGGFVTSDALFEAWLSAQLGIETKGGLGIDYFLGWAAIDTQTSKLDELEARDPKFVAAVEDYLHRTLRESGRVVWRAWRAKRGRSLLELAVLFETLASVDTVPARIWREMQKTELGLGDDETTRRVALELGEAVGRALRWLDRRDSHIVRSALLAAQARVTVGDVRELLIGSKRLPLAWDLRLEALGKALADGVKTPGPEALARAVDARRHVESHASASDPKEESVIRRAESAIQLLSWLSSGKLAPDLSTDTPYRDAEALGRWYVEEGGFVGHLRHQARGSATEGFGKGVCAVLDAVDAQRRTLDRRFARSLAGWVEAGRPASQVLPIDAAVDRIAVRFLQGDPTRKLLVLLMDGMAWAQAVSILASFDAWAVPWGPMAWHSSSQGKVGAALRPVVFAALPTVTEVSRAAFFAGKPTPAGPVQSTSDDPKRWLANKTVAKLEADTIEPKLLLRGEGHTSDGIASQEALSLVADPARRMVAIVINAIDASLKGDSQHHHLWKADSIRSFVDLLDKARESGRAVLLAADHGHVPASLLVAKSKQIDASARYRPWTKPDDPIAEDEVGFHGTGVWAPKGAHGVVLLADEHARYGGAAHAGEHGGASLAEVVAPCLLIAPSDGRDVADKDQRVMPLEKPSWWHLEVERPARIDETETTPPPRKPPPRRKNTPPQQAALFVGLASPNPPNPPPVRRKSSGRMRAPSALEMNELFIARTPNAEERRRIAKAVSYLAERGDQANLQAFAEAMGELPFRAGGLVRALGTALSVDGYEVLTYDQVSKQVRLQRAVLESQFGIKL